MFFHSSSGHPAAVSWCQVSWFPPAVGGPDLPARASAQGGRRSWRRTGRRTSENGKTSRRIASKTHHYACPSRRLSAKVQSCSRTSPWSEEGLYRWWGACGTEPYRPSLPSLPPLRSLLSCLPSPLPRQRGGGLVSQSHGCLCFFSGLMLPEGEGWQQNFIISAAVSCVWACTEETRSASFGRPTWPEAR